MLDDMVIRITQYKKETKTKECICEGYGSWIGSIVLDNKQYIKIVIILYRVWHFEDKTSIWKSDLSSGFKLPSDSLNRQDILELLKETPDFQLAQKLKKESVAQDIKDSRLRKKK